MPPAAITGTLTASTTCGTSAKVPDCVAMSSVKNMPRRHGRGRIDGKLAVVRRELVAPARLARVIERGRAMAEEIEIDRGARARADFSHLFAHLLGVEHGAGQRPERASLRCRDGQLAV